MRCVLTLWRHVRLDQVGVSYTGIKDKEHLVKMLRSAVSSSVEESGGDAAEQAILSSVRVRNAKTKEEEEIQCSAAFVAIGHDPNTKFVKGQVDMDANGYLATKPGTTRTSVDGVFAAGDVADHVYRQVRAPLVLALSLCIALRCALFCLHCPRGHGRCSSCAVVLLALSVWSLWCVL
jgi:thioredoxin reductase